MPGPTPKYLDGRRKGGAGAPHAVYLPASGWRGPTPEWPISPHHDEATDARERVVWAQLWTTPQAVAWAPLGAGTAHIIALYARLSVACEALDAPASLHAEVRQIGDRFGLTPMSMARLRWVVVDDEDQAARDAHPSAGPRLRSVRAVEGGAEVAELARRYRAVEPPSGA